MATFTDTFTTITQFDKSLDYLYTDYPRAKRGIAGPIFAIVTVSEYLNSLSLTKDRHETNINRAVTISAILSLLTNNIDQSLRSIIKTTDIPLELLITSTIHSNQIHDMIPDNITNHCTIIHKDNRYFVIISNSILKRYYIRDCNESRQYSFSTKECLISYLSDIYYKIDDQLPNECSTIEYIAIKTTFKDSFNRIVQQIIAPDVPNTNTNTNTNTSTNAFLGYVTNPPDDDTDMVALQRRFGGGGYDNERIHNVGNIETFHPHIRYRRCCSAMCRLEDSSSDSDVVPCIDNNDVMDKYDVDIDDDSVEDKFFSSDDDSDNI